MQFAEKVGDPKYAVFAHLPKGRFLLEARKIDEQERADREPPLRQAVAVINKEAVAESLAWTSVRPSNPCRHPSGPRSMTRSERSARSELLEKGGNR